MPEKNTDNKEKILDAMWRGDLIVKEEASEQEPAAEEAPEKTDEEKKRILREALEHLMSGRAFKERED